MNRIHFKLHTQVMLLTSLQEDARLRVLHEFKLHELYELEVELVGKR